MGKFFFSGSHSTRLDDKNRFVLPQNMRYGLIENGSLEFSMGLSLGGCLAIYRQSDIEKIVTGFQMKQHVAKYQKFFTVFFSTLFHTECDKVGRVNIPNHLKKIINIEQEVVIAGVLNKIEIWPTDVYQATIRSILEDTDSHEDLAKITEEAFALVEEDQQKDKETCKSPKTENIISLSS